MKFDRVESFHRPSRIQDAIRLLRGAGSQAGVLAGGTDLVLRTQRPVRVLIDLSALGLNYIRRKGGGCTIGAMTTMTDLEESAHIRAVAGGILAKAAASCGSVQIRNMATVGGNLANASPAADTAVPLLALDAVVVLAGSQGRRKIPLVEFFQGPGRAAVKGGLLVEVEIPSLPKGGRLGWSFQKLGRLESDISVVSCAAGIQVNRDGRCTWARIALGAVAPVPMRATAAEKLLLGRKLDVESAQCAAEKAAAAVKPISDIRASAEYRREMTAVMVRRALRDCGVAAGCWR